MRRRKGGRDPLGGQLLQGVEVERGDDAGVKRAVGPHGIAAQGVGDHPRVREDRLERRIVGQGVFVGRSHRAKVARGSVAVCRTSPPVL